MAQRAVDQWIKRVKKRRVVTSDIVHLTSALRSAETPPDGAFIYDTDTEELYVGDGESVGGNPVGTGRGVVTVYDDFLYPAISETDHPWILNAGTDAQAIDPAINVQEAGVIRVTAGDDDGSTAADGSQIVCSVPVQADSGDLVVETRLNIDTSIANIAVNFGLTDATGLEEPFSIANGEVVTSTASDAACFVYDCDTHASVAFSATDATADDIQCDAAHGLTTGQPCQILLDGGTAGGITANAVYYAVVVDADEFSIATTRANAIAGTVVNISADAGAGDVVPIPAWYALAVDGDTEDTGNGTTSSDFSDAPVADTYQTLRIEVSADGATIRFYIDGVLVKTLSGAAGVSPDANLYATVIACGDGVNGAAKLVDVDYIHVSHDRA